MLSVNQEQGALVELDQYAPYHGPYHEQYQALTAEFDALKNALLRAPRPSTPEGIRAFAKFTMVFAHRANEGMLYPDSLSDWLGMIVLTNAAGSVETVPLPPGWAERALIGRWRRVALPFGSLPRWYPIGIHAAAGPGRCGAKCNNWRAL